MPEELRPRDREAMQLGGKNRTWCSSVLFYCPHQLPMGEVRVVYIILIVHPTSV